MFNSIYVLFFSVTAAYVVGLFIGYQGGKAKVEKKVQDLIQDLRKFLNVEEAASEYAAGIMRGISQSIKRIRIKFKMWS